MKKVAKPHKRLSAAKFAAEPKDSLNLWAASTINGLAGKAA